MAAIVLGALVMGLVWGLLTWIAFSWIFSYFIGEQLGLYMGGAVGAVMGVVIAMYICGFFSRKKGGWAGMENWLLILLIGAFVIVFVIAIAFFIWLFWTVSWMIMDFTGTTKYGWPLQLVIFLVLWGISGGVSIKCK